MQKKLYHIELDETTEITEEQLKALQTIVPEAQFKTANQLFYGLTIENFTEAEAAKWAEYQVTEKKSFYVPYDCESLKLVDLNYFLSLQLDIPFTVKKIINIRFGTKDGRYSNNTFI